MIVQRGDTLTYDRSATSSRGSTETHVVLGLDGKAWRNTVAQNGADVATVSTVTWAHDTLVINSNASMNESALNTYERWSLSADGRSLMMFREVTLGGQVYASTNLLFMRTGPALPTVTPNAVATQMSERMPGGRESGIIKRVDFNGVWILDFARSDSSSYTPKSATYAVSQYKDSIMVDRESPGAGKQHAVYMLDGSPRKYTLRLVGTETEATSTITWISSGMIVHTTSRPNDAELVQTDTWTLNADGSELRIRREASYNGSPMGSPTLVFTRKAP